MDCYRRHHNIRYARKLTGKIATKATPIVFTKLSTKLRWLLDTGFPSIT